MSESSPALSVFLPKMQGYGILPSYSINLIQIPNSSFEKTFALFREGYVLAKDTIEHEGVSVINGIQFKWILKKNSSPTKDKSLVYFGYSKGIIYQLSFTTSKSIFLKYEPLVKEMFATFKF